MEEGPPPGGPFVSTATLAVAVRPPSYPPPTTTTPNTLQGGSALAVKARCKKAFNLKKGKRGKKGKKK